MSSWMSYEGDVVRPNVGLNSAFVFFDLARVHPEWGYVRMIVDEDETKSCEVHVDLEGLRVLRSQVTQAIAHLEKGERSRSAHRAARREEVAARPVPEVGASEVAAE